MGGPFALTLPKAERARLRTVYKAAGTILEYGSGGSTMFAAGLKGKTVYSVESDPEWARRMRAELDAADLPSPVTIHHVDIGPIGKWGRPVDTAHWSRFHRLPLSVWDLPDFRHPDAVLVDGRFRAACFVATCLRISRPVTLLFDDYATREIYARVERIAPPREVVGRMAVFDLVPGLVTPELIGFAFEAFSWATYGSKVPRAAYRDAAAADRA